MTLTTRTTRIGRTRLLLGLASFLAVVLVGQLEASAQRTTATVAVEVTAAGGAPPAGVTVVALNTSTGLAVLGTPRANGSQLLTGLAPGEYLITATPPSGQEVYRLVRVEVGQTLTLDLDLGQQTASAAAPAGETIIVEGRVSENATSEIATNVSREQIENLPQNNRNFLNFAELAPGVRVSQDELRKELIAGAQGASQTNVFIDGVSLKSNVQQGGIVGQDSTRGNPFPQLAVGGFRVITQNYKAEYEQAGSAIITAITRSGGNDYHGDIFTSFQHESLTAIDHFVAKNNQPEPDLARYQVGAAASGPVVKDKLFVFLTYEGNYQDRQSQVVLTNPPPELMERFADQAGTFTSPFREHLGFGKFTWRPATDQNVEISGGLRYETDVRSFGGTVSQESAENVRNRVYMASAKHQWWVGSMLNEATFQYLENHFNPEPENPDLVGQQFFAGALNSPEVIRVGGRDTTQDSGQRGFTLRDDITFSDIEAGGQHVVKTGAKVSFQNFTVDKQFNGNPLFKFYNDPAFGLTYDLPAEAIYGVGDPLVEANNTQIGLYVQDDWQIGRRLTLNLGVRWDIETNALNNDYETPEAIRTAMLETPYSFTPPEGSGVPGCTNIPFAECIQQVNGADYFDVDNYLTDGGDRPIFLGAVQPRIGFAFDVLGDRNTVLFGGAGRYYDRSLFADGVDEKYRLQYGVRTFRFSPDGMPRDGNPTIVWDPAYLSQNGLDQLIASGVAPAPEIYLLENDTKPLRTDQFSGGVRQQLGPVSTSLTLTHARSENGLGFYPANRVATGNRDFMPSPAGYGTVVLSADDRESRYTSVQVGIEKPLDYELSAGGIMWGASVAYTLAWAKERGGLFNFDFPTIEDSPMAPTSTDERHRLVLSGITRLPLDFLLSTLIRLGTGLPYTINDHSAGDMNSQVDFRVNEGRADKFLEFRQVDLRLAKEFALTDNHRLSAFVECFNVFNSKNFGGYNGFIPSPGGMNPDFGKPSTLVGPPRSLQLGMAYRF